MDLITKPARRSEVEEILSLVNSAYRGESSRMGWTTEADFLDGQRTDNGSLTAMIESENKVILCLRDKETEILVGCVSAELFTDEKGEGCYVGMLSVKPTMQTSGLGKVLLESAEIQAQEWGATRVTLGVLNLREELMAWYERRGYRKTKHTKPFPYGDEKFGIPKVPGMFFVFFEKIFSEQK